MNRTLRILLFASLLGGALLSCSTKKNTAVNRFYHDLNAKYNGYFNANESFKEGVASLESAHKDNYKKVLPIYFFGDEESSKSVFPAMDKAIKKCSKVIQRHSMDIGGNEYCKFIDDAYLLIGKSRFYKREYDEGKVTFNYIITRYRGTNSHLPAHFWLIRNHVEQENYYEAERLIDDLEREKSIPPQHLEDYHATVAHFFLRQGDFEHAIPDLEKAIEYCRKKRKQTRWMFILAQLYQETNESALAMAKYEEVEKRNLDYELTFYAQLNRAFAYDAEQVDGTGVKETLVRMSKDDKNIEYLDQIYYGLADVYLKEGDEEIAIDYLIQSTEASTTNTNQKGESFLRLAELYFEHPDYVAAQMNYDSAVTYLDKEREDFEQIMSLRNNLTSIVQNMTIIQTEDSLQRLAMMSEEDRNDFIIDYIERQKELKEEQEREREIAEELAQINRQQGAGQDPFAEASSEWYFYNSTILEYGRSEFSKTWGGRKNEDNWRRADKSSQDLSFEDLNEGNIGVSALADDDPDKYLEFLPLDSASMAASHARVQKAYYDLGVVYKEEMDDSKNAIQSFEGLVNRYDTSEYHLSTYYQLYRLHYNAMNDSKANYYKNLILNKYPETDYAKVLINPNYLNELAAQKGALDLYYEKTYGYYERRLYRQSILNCREADKLFVENSLKPKFDLILGLSLGYVYGRDSLVAGLNNVIRTHKNSEEKKYAESILAVLNRAPSEEEEDLPDYVLDEGSAHLAIILMPENVSSDRTKLALANFNAAYFRLDALKIQALMLGKKNKLFSIKQFKNMEKAMAYHLAFEQNKTKLKFVHENKSEFFVISYDNYAKLFESQNVEHYLDFFEENY